MTDGFSGKITKEDYIITENKCLKMWISAMQVTVTYISFWKKDQFASNDEMD